ncbi:NADPH:quinone reductase [Actinomadura sp. SCN-SB]|uniref:NADPH:quinone reductase n=1 Tax=Actinomadura sp. SCN-SB TaxID=3373092 RepID=UPI0037503B29
MRAVWYEANGAAEDVLRIGELPDPEPPPGYVRVRVAVSGVNPRDVKRRSGVGGRTMTEPLVIPGDDGAGVIDRVGSGVSDARLGERVWVHSATFSGPSGTCAEFVVVPASHALTLPENADFGVGACLGVPALTAYRCVHADGPVDGSYVLVTGGAGAVGHYAIEFAKHAGATVIATASTPEKQKSARAAGADLVVDYRDPGAAERITAFTGPAGVHRIVDVDFGANLDLSLAVIAVNGTIATYSSNSRPDPILPFYSLMRRSITVRTVLVFQTPERELAAATSAVSRLLSDGSLTHPIAVRLPLDQAAKAHNLVESGKVIGKVLIHI